MIPYLMIECMCEVEVEVRDQVEGKSERGHWRPPPHATCLVGCLKRTTPARAVKIRHITVASDM